MGNCDGGRRLALIIGFLLGSVLGVLLAYSINEAEGHQIKCENEIRKDIIGGLDCSILHLLWHMIEEEEKQTALLDQTNCYISLGNQFNSREWIREKCGEPLNVTGVWKP